MEIWEEINEELKKMEKKLDSNICIIEEAKSEYEKYILDEEYPRLLGRYIKEIEENKRLLEEIKLKNNRINYLEDKLNRLENGNISGFVKLKIKGKEIERHFSCKNIIILENVLEFYDVEFIPIEGKFDGCLTWRKYSQHRFSLENVIEIKI